MLKKYHTFLCVRLMRARVINYLVTLAVAGSVFVLIVVLSVMWGFDRDLRTRIRGTLADVSIESVGLDRVQDYDTVISWIKEDAQLGPLVKECSPYAQCFVFLSWSDSGTTYTLYAMARGIDFDREKNVSDLASYLQGGKSPDFNLDGGEPPYPGLLIGQQLAKDIDLRPDGELQKGARIQLTPPMSRGVFLSSPTFTLVGEFKSGYLEYDSRFVYIPLKEAQRLAGYDYDEASGISIALKDYNQADRAKELLEQKLKGIYPVRTWAEQRKPLLEAVHLERVVMAVILGSLVLLAALFVCAVMLMAVKEKTRDIGILKALGGTVGGIMRIFLVNGLVIGVTGAAVGAAGGLLFVKYINSIARFAEQYLGLQVFPRDIYYLDKIPTFVDATGVCLIVFSAIAASLLAAVVPSLIAARLNPVEALRYE